MLAIMKDVSAIAAVPEASIWVYLCNLEPTDVVEFGRVAATRRGAGLV